MLAFFLGALVGGALITTLVGQFVGLAFKADEPSGRAGKASAFGWIVVSIIAGFGMADGGGFRFDACLYYFPGAALAFFYLRWHYAKSWEEDEV